MGKFGERRYGNLLNSLVRLSPRTASNAFGRLSKVQWFTWSGSFVHPVVDSSCCCHEQGVKTVLPHIFWLPKTKDRFLRSTKNMYSIYEYMLEYF